MDHEEGKFQLIKFWKDLCVFVYLFSYRSFVVFFFVLAQGDEITEIVTTFQPVVDDTDDTQLCRHIASLYIELGLFADARYVKYFSN